MLNLKHKTIPQLNFSILKDYIHLCSWSKNQEIVLRKLSNLLSKSTDSRRNQVGDFAGPMEFQRMQSMQGKG